MLICGASACAQELALPHAGKGGDASTGDAGLDGITGASAGARDDEQSRSRLPVADAPIFTTFGGAGGEAGSDAELGGIAPRAGSGTGGKTTHGGTSGAGGSGGKAATGGSATASAGGAGGEAGAEVAPSGPPQLFFSEYVEGSGSFKALEIYALDATSLEGCELDTYFNGKLEPGRLSLHGVLARGELQVLCSSALATAQPTICDRSTALTFNGDDALALSCGGVTLDVIGQIGVDPGDAWSNGATLDHTLRRRCTVVAGRRDGSAAFSIDAEWQLYGVDTFSDLGKRTCPTP
jgi:hypothetical protein